MKFNILKVLFQNAKIQDLNVIHNAIKTYQSDMKLFQNAKIQDLNVIHNLYNGLLHNNAVVSECKDTRFECNSQLDSSLQKQILGCFRMQRYKIWM